MPETTPGIETRESSGRITELEQTAARLEREYFTPADAQRLITLASKLNSIASQIQAPESGLETEKEEVEQSPALADAERSPAVDQKLETVKINLRTAIDHFTTGMDKLIAEMRGVSGLFAVGGLYAASWETPSQRYFAGDRRVAEKRTEKEKVLADLISKEEILEEVRAFKPELAIRLSALLDEFDGWKRIYRERVREGFNAAGEFKAMVKRVSDGLKQIEREL